jgi:uncharacterized damage-inducible protein DinB
MSDVTLSRLYRHMAWANNHLFTRLSTLPEEALSFSAWNPDWTVGKLANHIVFAQGRLISRIEKAPAPDEVEYPLTATGMKGLTVQASINDSRIQELLDTPDEMRTFIRYGNEVSFLTSTILAQYVFHATEHRAQIADILAANNMDVINLDDIDLWSFERSEKL